MDFPGSFHKVPLSSITSTELRKIIFSATNANHYWILSRRAEDWGLVDKQMCELVNQLSAMGYRRTLEAELRFINPTGNLEINDYTRFLPGFREKGVVTVVDVARGNRILHCSAHGR